MSSKSYGLPHKEGLPKLSSDPVNSDQGSFWSEDWAGYGLLTDIYVVPKSTTDVHEDTPNNIMPGIVMEMDTAINLTHVSMICDTRFQSIEYGTSYVSFPLQCQYSIDGDQWTPLPLSAVGWGFYFKSGANADMPLYVWIPPNTIRAKYWRIDLVVDTFTSSYGDTYWHISEIRPGTLDNVDGVLADTSTIGNPLTPAELPNNTGAVRLEDILPWPSIGMLHTTGLRLSVMILCASDEYSNTYYNNTALVWMDKETIMHNLVHNPRGIGDDYAASSEATVSILTNTGFITHIGSLNNPASWESNGDNLVGNYIYGTNYLGFGFPNDPQKDVATVRISASTGGLIVNPLGIAPDCIWLYSGVEFIGVTHPDYPNEMFSVEDIGVTDVVIRTATTIQLASAYTDPNAGIIVMMKKTGVFTAGEYTGSGVAGNSVATTGVKPSVVMIKRKDSAEHMIVSNYHRSFYMVDAVTGFNTRIDALTFTEAGFDVEFTDTEFNEAGGTYLWWAWQ